VISYVDLLHKFLDWLGAEVDALDDARVTAAYRRNRRQLRYKRILAPGLEILDRLLARTPDKYLYRLQATVPRKFHGPIQRALRRCRAQ
jgi:hypothetical protein